jgi:hypothetical protein
MISLSWIYVIIDLHLCYQEFVISFPNDDITDNNIWNLQWYEMSPDSKQFIHDFTAGEWMGLEQSSGRCSPKHAKGYVVHRLWNAHRWNWYRRTHLNLEAQPLTTQTHRAAITERARTWGNTPFFSIDLFFVKARPLAGRDRWNFCCDLAWSFRDIGIIVFF